MTTMRTPLRSAVWLATAFALAECANPPVPPPNLLAPTEEQAALRAMQTRTFEVADRTQAMRGVIAALQDLGFIIERANDALGLVTAARFAEPGYNDMVGVTVIVRPQGADKMEIRVNAIYDNKPITDANIYQNFFATLEHSLFIGRT
ncbi:MAG TPA: hypothetical protein VMW19_20765 [Myxococcota bacterium]|nr:hypothetical protein [Myxococcota bacterium]